MQTVANKPVISYLNQAHMGVYLGVGALLGIEAHSFSPLLTVAAFGAFMSLPAFGRFAFTHRDSRAWRATGWLAVTAFAIGVLSSVAMFAERLYYVNAKTYPAWLATRDIGQVGAFPFLRDADISKLCAHEGFVAITQKEQGEIVVRCNDAAMRPFTRVYIGHTDGGK